MPRSKHIFNFEKLITTSGKQRVRVFQGQNDDETSKQKGEPTGIDLVRLRQTDTQSFLMGALEQLSAFHRDGQGKIGLINGQLQFDPEQNEAAMSLVSMLSNPKDVDEFINATPAQLSRLVPHIEFYLESADKQKKKQKKILFSDFTSGARTRGIGDIKGGIFDMGSGAAREILGAPGDDVGIKEFSWTFDNKHEGDKTIKASLSLYFANAVDLVHRKNLDDEADYINFIFTNLDEPRDKKSKTAAQLLQEVVAYFDKMNGNPVLQYYDGQQLSAEPKNFTQLKCVVGWSLLDDSESARKAFLGTDAEFESFKSGVDNSQRVITLQFTKYTLDFGEQGQVNLTVEYVGSLDSALTDVRITNIFAGQTVYNQEHTIPTSRDFESGLFTWAGGAYATKSDLKGRAFGVTAGNPSANIFQSAEGSNAGLSDDNLAGLEEDHADRTGGGNIKGVLGFKKGILFQSIQKGLRDGIELEELNDAAGFRFTIHAAEFEEKALQTLLEYYKKTELPSSQNNQERKNLVELATTGLAAVREAKTMVLSKIGTEQWQRLLGTLLTSSSLKIVAVSSKAMDSGDPTVAAGLGSSIKVEPRLVNRSSQSDVNFANSKKDAFLRVTQAQRKKDAGQGTTRGIVGFRTDDLNSLDPSENVQLPNNPAGTISVAYTTVGEILNQVLRGVMGHASPTALGTTLSERFKANLLLGSLDLYELGISASPNPKRPVAIADIPISVEWFSQWVVDNFTRSNPPQRKIPLRHFLNRFFNSLLAPLINKSFSTEDNRVKVVFDMTTVTFPFKRQGATDLENAAVSRSGRVTTHMVQQAAAAGSDASALADPDQETITYLVVYPTNKERKKLVGDEEQDKKRGIFHFELGADRGLVKRYVFKEKKMPHLKAMHIENSNTTGALIMPLDLELTMVGNAFFRNGSVIYVSADTIAPGIQSDLHLGGYYQVVKSENTINASTYETRLTCMYLQGPEE